MYAMPDKVTSAVIEPKYLVSHVLKFTSEGREVLSRRQLLAYSVATEPHCLRIGAHAQSQQPG